MNNDHNITISYGLKEVLERIEASQIAMLSKLDLKAEQSNVEDIDRRVTALETSEISKDRIADALISNSDRSSRKTDQDFTKREKLAGLMISFTAVIISAIYMISNAR